MLRFRVTNTRWTIQSCVMTVQYNRGLLLVARFAKVEFEMLSGTTILVKTIRVYCVCVCVFEGQKVKSRLLFYSRRLTRLFFKTFYQTIRVSHISSPWNPKYRKPTNTPMTSGQTVVITTTYELFGKFENKYYFRKRRRFPNSISWRHLDRTAFRKCFPTFTRQHFNEKWHARRQWQ